MKVLAAILLGVASWAVQQSTARDSMASKNATTRISGVVLSDEPSPRPLRRARVLLNGPVGHTAITEDDGGFAFTGLPGSAQWRGERRICRHELRCETNRAEGNGDHARAQRIGEHRHQPTEGQRDHWNDHRCTGSRRRVRPCRSWSIGSPAKGRTAARSAQSGKVDHHRRPRGVPGLWASSGRVRRVREQTAAGERGAHAVGR